MKNLFLLVFFALTLGLSSGMYAQAPKSSGKALFRSVVLPGWGQQYLNDGSWKGKASAYATVDLGLWLGVLTSIRRHGHYTHAAQNYAQFQANASLEGKDRDFLVRIGNYDSSQDYLYALELARRWNLIEAASEPVNSWTWGSTEERATYSQLRDQAEAMRRQRILFTGLLVGNRLLSAISAARGTRLHNKALVQFSTQDGAPSLSLTVQF